MRWYEAFFALFAALVAILLASPPSAFGTQGNLLAFDTAEAKMSKIHGLEETLSVDGDSVSSGIQALKSSALIAQEFAAHVTEPFPDGYYTLGSYADPSLKIGVSGADQKPGAHAQLQASSNELSQRLSQVIHLERLNDGTYLLSFPFSDLCFDVTSTSSEPGATVRQWFRTNSHSQRWIISSAGDNSFKLKSLDSGTYLDLEEGTPEAGVTIKVNPGDNVDSQRFVFTPDTLWISLPRYLWSLDSMNDTNLLSEVVAANTENGGTEMVIARTGDIAHSEDIKVAERNNDETDENAKGTKQYVYKIGDTPDSDSISLYGSPWLDSSAVSFVCQAIRNIQGAGHQVGFVMLDLTTGRGASYNADQSFYSASSVKAPYLISLLRLNPTLFDLWRDTYESVLRYSDNNAYLQIRETFGPDAFSTFCEYCDVRADIATYNFTDFSPLELAKLWAGVYEYVETSGSIGETIKTEMNNPEYSSIKNSLGDRAYTISKGGWIASSDHYCVTNDAGIVYAGNRPYLLSIMSTIPADMGELYELTTALDNLHTLLVTY